MVFLAGKEIAKRRQDAVSLDGLGVFGAVCVRRSCPMRTRQKRPMHVAKEAYAYGKRGKRGAGLPDR